jgi:hypothetical protein
VDNHRSHRAAIGGNPDEKVTFGPAANLLFTWLVPHASDQTQPLDLEIFSIQKRETQKQKKDRKYTIFTNTLINAILGMEKASTTKNIIKASRAAGIVRQIQPGTSKTILKIDRSEANSVRHWNSYVEEIPVTGDRSTEL